MGCAPSSPTHEEQAFVEGRSPFFIKESLQAVEKTPGGSQKKVKKYRKKLVPRLKSITESNIMLKRNRTFSSISSISIDLSPSHSLKSISPTDQEERINKGNMMEKYFK